MRDRRSNRVLLGTAAVFSAKVFAFISQWLLTFALARVLSPEDFGLWGVLSSISLVVAFFDFGITGHSLRNQLALMAALNGCYDRQRKQFLSALYASLLFYGVFIFVFIGLFPYLPWERLWQGAHHLRAKEISQAALLFFLLRAPFVINTNGFFAYQEAHLKSLFECLEWLLVAIATVAGIYIELSFPLLMTVYCAAFATGPVLSTIFLMRVRRWKWGFLAPREILEGLKPLLKTSLAFWIYNLASVGLFALQPFFFAHFIGLAAAGEFMITLKCFTLFFGVHFTFLTPLWAAYTEAYHAQDYAWIFSSFKKTIHITFGYFGAGVIAMGLSFQYIIFFWTEKWLGISFIPSAMLCTMTLLFLAINCMGTLLSSLNIIKMQAISFSCGLLIFAALCFILNRHITSLSMTLSTICAMLPLFITNGVQTKSLIKRIGQGSMRKPISL